jgi:hemoglobin
MNDIQTQKDLFLLVDEFYKKLLSDDSISYIFTDVVKIKLEGHLPILVTFWSQGILGTGGYTKNLTRIHLEVNKFCAYFLIISQLKSLCCLIPDL